MKYLAKIVLFCCCGSLVFSATAQQTVGLLSYVPMKSFDGYNLMYPHNQPNVYLLDNCGEIVHVWEDSTNYRPGNMAYLLENGHLLKAKRPASIAGDAIWAGGGGATVELRDWDNQLLWSFTLNDSLNRLHHDIAPKPNGNILLLSWERKSREEAIAAGRDTALLSQNNLWPDYLMEVQPIGPDSFEIVWQWHVWDHLIQDFDSTKANYGVVGDHPELVDINWDTNDGASDWMHTNALDYDPVHEQVLISVPTFHEVWIIDQSTSTAQAAGHTGGMSNRGGDLMYRWGNPAAYQQGDSTDQRLFYPHDIHWVDDFLTASHPQYRRLAAFNNRVTADSSTVVAWNPSWDMYSWSYLMDGNRWEPAELDWIYSHPDKSLMHSTGLSSVQFLPNGNALVCVGRWGYSFEVTPDEEIVWEYKTPLIGGNPANQGDTLAINNNLTFRLKRYPADYAAFQGKALTSIGYIEQNPDTTFCDQFISSVDDRFEYHISVYPNPASEQLTIEWEGGRYVDIELLNMWGQSMKRFRESGGRKYLDVSDWQKGLYFIRVDSKATVKIVLE
ncbi:MAG: aryl-sulfate sulfotransferase [Bacteroidota bacterium]